jgi:glycerate dehydrogenase
MVPPQERLIVVLDGFALNPGDLSWDGLGALGRVVVHERSGPEEIPRRARGAFALLVNKAVLSGETLRGLPSLRYIGVLATGTNTVDVGAARGRGVAVTNVPAYSTDSVAQLALALLLALAHHAEEHSRLVREGRWAASPDFSWHHYPLVELAGKTFGAVGYGAIGRRAAALARAFGMEVLAATRSPRSPEEGVTFVSLDELFLASDVVSLHCPLTPETAKMIDARALSLMKPGAFLVNTARGGLVDEQALAEALEQGRLAGAGEDVLAAEPPRHGSPLLTARNCVITPHIGWATHQARSRLMAEAVENLRAFLEGKERNRV